MKNNSETKGPFVFRCYSKSELAALYKVSRPTMRKWIRPVLIAIGATLTARIITIAQLHHIVAHLGLPPGDWL